MNRRNSLSYGIIGATMERDSASSSFYATTGASLLRGATQPTAPVVSSSVPAPVPSSELRSSHLASLAQMCESMGEDRGDVEFRDGINDAPVGLLQMLQRPAAASSFHRVSDKRAPPIPSPTCSDTVLQKPSFVMTPSALLKEVQQPQTLTSFSASLSALLAASQPGVVGPPLSLRPQDRADSSSSSSASSLIDYARANSSASSLGESSNSGNNISSGGSANGQQPQRFKPFHEEKWSQRLEELCHFRRQHGHCLVPHAYPPNPQLACWVKRQRRQYKLMKEGSRASTMSPERIALLEDVGFIWDSHDAGWTERFLELKQYRNEYGNCLVPSTYKKNTHLAIWVKCQRRQYKLWREGRSSSMTEERRRQLDEVGFSWEARPALQV